MLLLRAGADALLVGQGGKGWDSVQLLMDGWKILSLRTVLPAQFYMTTKSSEGEALGRKTNTVQLLFFRTSDYFQNSCIARKTSKKADEVVFYNLSLETHIFILWILPVISRVSGQRKTSCLHNHKQKTSQQRKYLFQFQTRSNNLSEQISYKVSEWLADMKVFSYLDSQVQRFC